MSYLTHATLSEAASATGYPYSVPAVQAVGDVHFDQVTVIVGANGSGKSTLIEAIAVAAGFNAEGGSRNLMFETHATHSALANNIDLWWHKRPRWGWFLRAETFYGMATHIENDGYLRPTFPDLHNRSHGESFLEIIEEKMTSDGLFILDEPESALSFHGQLALLGTMHRAVSSGAQFIVATHSPILMAFPGAAIYELDEDGAHRAPYDETEAVTLWRSFLASPERFFHHLFASDDDDDARGCGIQG